MTSLWKSPYRYTLRRELSVASTKRLCWIMLNPSTATDVKDDQTIRKIKTISEAHGYGHLVVVNIFAWRATEPKELREAYDNGEDVWGEYNIQHTLNEVMSADGVVFAWGNYNFRWAGIDPVKDMLHVLDQCHHERPPLCCGKNKNGSPKHPCYLPNDTALVPY